MIQDVLRRLPSVDEVMSAQEISRSLTEHDRETIVCAVRAVIDSVRAEIVQGTCSDPEKAVEPSAIAERAAADLDRKFAPSIHYVINATGIILHTGLGRAMMPVEAAEAVANVVVGYCNLAADAEKGQRTSRDIHYDHLLCELTGAEAATVVNNNAAATMIILNTLAKGKEVIVSRGQLVEIGGAFRMPEVMETSGAILREVGATNKTHLRDYAAAINENTGAILHVHSSNYRIVGFFEEPGIAELAELAHKHNLPVIDDLGSGALIDLGAYGLEPEPMVVDSINAGADVCCFSGDKLIGGPQCGIIIGKSDWIKAIKKNPLARALRIGKMEVAALEATLKLFFDKGKINERHPTYRKLSLTPEQIETRARAVADTLAQINADIAIIDGSSQVGSGSVPAEMLPTRLLSIRPKSITAEALAKQLRKYNPPVFSRIHQESVLLDLRTVAPEEDKIVAAALQDILT